MAMTNEITVSGCIKFDPLGGGSYVIRTPHGNMGWGIPVDHIAPDDLRAMADHLEGRRGKRDTPPVLSLTLVTDIVSDEEGVRFRTSEVSLPGGVEIEHGEWQRMLDCCRLPSEEQT